MIILICISQLYSLGKRLPRMPFPPLTKDSVFEYEAALKEHVSNAQLNLFATRYN